MIRTTAVIEQGWNLGGMLGYSAGNGQTRFAFFTVDPWEKGWVTHAPYGQFDLEYGFADNFAVRLRVPLSVLFSDLDLYYKFMNDVGAGVSLGWAPSVYLIGTLPLSDSMYLSLSPSVLFPNWGVSRGAYDNKDFSRVQFNIQASLGYHIDPVDFGLEVAYAYAPGTGAESEVITSSAITLDSDLLYEEMAINHMLTVGGFVNF